MVTIDQLKNGIAAYLDREFLPKLPYTPSKKFAVGVALGLFIKRFDNIYLAYRDNPVIKMLGVIDDNGSIDIDILAEVIKERLGDKGFEFAIPVIGPITIEQADVDNLYGYITK